MAITNMTCTLNLNCTLDLPKIKAFYPHVMYEPNKFNGLRFKVRDDECNATALLFSKGKIVLTGTKSLEGTQRASKTLAWLLSHAGFQTCITDIQIRNIVWANRFDNPISVENFCRSTKQASYEVELFPGGVYSFESSRAKVIFFHTGKYYICGVKSYDECRQKDSLFREAILSFQANIKS